MSDFSHYSRRTDEWLAIEANLPPRPIATGDGIYTLQAATNKEWEEASAAAMEEFAAQVTIRDHTIPTRDGQMIEARSYRPAVLDGGGGQQTLPVYLHLHGGGFVYGSIAAEDATCARIAVNTGVVVLHVNYRHTPDHVYPTAFDDAEDGFVWLHSHVDDLRVDPQKVVVGGISAGGQLTASLVLRKNLGKLGDAAQACPPVAGQVLMIPCVAHHDCQAKLLEKIKDPSVWSHRQNENAPMLPMAIVKMFIGLLKIDNPGLNDLKLNPGNASPDDVKGLPPTTFGVAGLDPLRDEGLLYAKLLSENGWVLAMNNKRLENSSRSEMMAWYSYNADD